MGRESPARKTRPESRILGSAPTSSSPCRVRPLVSGKDRERAALEGRDRPKRPLIERQDPPRRVPLGDDDERGVGKPDTKVPVSRNDTPRRAELRQIQALDDEGALHEVVEKRQLDVRPKAVQDQVVRLRDRELGRDQRLELVLEDGPNRSVAGLVRVGLRVQRAGVDDEGHYRPPIRWR